MDVNSFLNTRRQAVEKAWDLTNEVVLIYSGQPIPVPGGADQTYPFIAHKDYVFLTERESPHEVLAFDPHEGWTLFAPRPSEDDAIWIGEYEEVGKSLKEFTTWIGQRHTREIISLGAPPETSNDPRSEQLQTQLAQVRMNKDTLAIAKVRQAVALTTQGFAKVASLIAPGVTERQLQVELEAEMFRAGSYRMAYPTIVASGPNSAVLHFHPTERRIQEQDLVLIDAGCEWECYAADVTRTFCVGEFSPEQKEIYQIVLAAQQAAIEMCQPGEEFIRIHLKAAEVIAKGLMNMGLLKGSLETVMEQELYSLFFPHGVGHTVGLGVRDAGSYLPERKESQLKRPRFLRLDVPIEKDFLFTIEPGLYFIPRLLKNEQIRNKTRQWVDWSKVDSFIGIGGVRLEENILVTETGPEILTKDIPK